MIVFAGHVVQLSIHRNGQHQLLLHLQVPTVLPLVETAKQHDDMLVGKLRNFKLCSAQSAQSGRTKKAKRSQKKMLGAALFLCAAACYSRCSPH